MNIYMRKPNATHEFPWFTISEPDDYERTEALDQCDPMVGLAPGFPNEYFDWCAYHQER